MSIALVHADGMLRLDRETLRVAWGRAGLSSHKQEGDDATPVCDLPIRRVLYRADRVPRPRTVVPAEPIAPEDGWCDDPADSRYNQFVRLPYAARHEELWRTDRLYDIVCVLGWNDRPVVRGFGSAIFLHVATADYAPTAGCLALALDDLQRVLALGVTGIGFA